MEHLELEHIFPYLPYELKWKYIGQDEDYGSVLKMNNLSIGCKVSLTTELNTFTIQNFDTVNFEFLPILKPLTNETIKEVFAPMFEENSNNPELEYLTEEYLSSFEITIAEIPSLKAEWLPKGTFDLLVKYKFDVFNLISEDLAYDVALLPNGR